jgi:hypothetical protein
MSWQFVLDENLFKIGPFSNKPLLGAPNCLSPTDDYLCPFFLMTKPNRSRLYEPCCHQVLFLGGRNSEMDLT